jgi:hypothetical protein
MWKTWNDGEGEMKLKLRETDVGPQRWKPHKYQSKAVEFLLERVGGGLFLKPGAGKTSIVLKCLQVLKVSKRLRCALIIAPLRVCHQVWPEELIKWSDFGNLTMTVLHGPGKEKLLDAKTDVYVINPEGLEWFLRAGGMSRLKPDVLVVDELSKFKNAKSKRFKMLKPWLSSFTHRWGLTGSPAPKGLIDLFGQMYLLDMGRSLGQYITHYRAKYFTPGGYGGYTWTLQKGADKRIHDVIRDTVMTVELGDEIPLFDNFIYVELPPKVRKIYSDMEKEFIAWYERGGEPVTAVTAAVASMKCAQIANGGLYKQATPGQKPTVTSDRWVNLHDEKTDAVVDLVEELQGEPLLIAYDFAHDLDRLTKALLPYWKSYAKYAGMSAAVLPRIGGGVSTKLAKAYEDAWNAGLLPFLLAHPASMAHGLNAQGGGFNVCWHSLTWDYELYDQFIRRLRRQGQQSNRVMNHLVIAKDTVDLLKLISLRRKEGGQEDLFDALKDYRKRR